MPLPAALSSFFSSAGRADRATFWANLAVTALALGAGIAVFNLCGENGAFGEAVLARPLRVAVKIAAFAGILAMFARFGGICTRRRRDCRMSESMHSLRLVPYAGRFIHLAALGFLPSREDPVEVVASVFAGPVGPTADRTATTTTTAPTAPMAPTGHRPTL